MIKSLALMAALTTGLSACATGPYDPSTHHQQDASTGSMLGSDMGAESSGLTDTAVGSNKGQGQPGHGGD